MSDLFTPTALWTMGVGIMAGTSCAAVGCYLVLRRMSMLGDAISHSVLPGIAVAVLWSGEFGGWTSFVGALVFGVVCTVLIELLHHKGGLTSDSSMGVVFSGLFSIGVIIIAREARRKHIDADCILFGLIEAVPLDTVAIGGWEIPRAAITLGIVLVLVLGIIALLWKEFKIVSFDGALASAMGLSATLVHYLLMGLVALVSVACFEAVGSILVVALLIVPPATAHLLSDRLWAMMGLSILASAIAAVGGYALADASNTSVSGMIAVVAGIEFAMAVILSPRHGLVSRGFRNLALSVRIAAEDFLGRLYREDEIKSGVRAYRPLEASSAGLVVDWLGMILLARRRWVVRRGRVWELTPAGREKGAQLVASHRLWEEYAGENLNLPADHRHFAAHRMEHFINPELREEISRELRPPTSL